MTKSSNIFDSEFLTKLQGLYIVAKKIATKSGAALNKSSDLGDGLEFADHRDYFPGDDTRFIDWSYYARMEKVLLRMFHTHSQSDVAILLDASASMQTAVNESDESIFDYARKISAALSYIAIGSGHRTIVQPFSNSLTDQFRTGRNKSNILNVLEFLANIAPANQTALADCAQSFAQLSGNISTVVLISDFFESANQLSQALTYLAGVKNRRDIIVIHTYRQADVNPQLTGSVLLTDAETNNQLKVDINSKLIEAYKIKWNEFTDKIKATCNAKNATYISACSNIPFEELVLKSLRKAGVLN